MSRIYKIAAVQVLLSITVLSGCHTSQNPQASRLAGVWVITATDSLMRRVGQNTSMPSGSDQPASVDDPDKAKMVLEFSSRGYLKTTTRLGRVDPPPKEGNWSVLAWDETKQVLSIECVLAGQTTQHEVKFIEPDLIELIPPNMAGTQGKLRFRRTQ